MVWLNVTFNAVMQWALAHAGESVLPNVANSLCADLSDEFASCCCLQDNVLC